MSQPYPVGGEEMETRNARRLSSSLALAALAALAAPASLAAQRGLPDASPIGVRLDAWTRLADGPAITPALAIALGTRARRTDLWLEYGSSGTTLLLEGAPASAGDTNRVAPSSTTTRRSAVDRWALGASRRLGAFSVALVAGSSRGLVASGGTQARVVRDSVWTDTLGWVPDDRTIPGLPGRAIPARWATAELRGGWAGERVALALTLGGRPRSRALAGAAWSGVEGAARLASGVWLAGALVAGPDALDARRQRGWSGRLGLRFTTEMHKSAMPAPAGTARAPGATPPFAVARLGAGVYRIALSEPDARSVELSADFTGWKPIALARAAGGLWIADVHAAPGAYRVNVRVNGGEWAAPPGTVAVDDGFGGSAGVVVIPES